ncbi:transcriptional regulator, GntR family [Bifidobacterium lemurum]|uniref:Transcriptional regulator, GntR family n=1 Tax=Bifidobacterium lemurum TaxID=1603886 RepID=A0A261FQJ1_9BIFI|nr:GntR family transcriptional regulator [Bifidobacterium lemurum]OZG61451.1 transcriptional regulator, GntR family [Bifidobacterium lemurum]QOL35123.1 GntR family transcriptional regulator [Bifidobacterium lemurum]
MTEQSTSRRRLPSQSVADDLARRIEQGEYRDGDRLDSESALAKEFGVARGTMRNALEILKDRNLVTTKPGVGSFVSFHGHTMEGAGGWAAASARAGSPTVTEVLGMERQVPPEELRREYDIDGDVHRVVRRRLIGDVPVSVEVSYLPSNTLLDLLMERGLLGDSISLTMKAAHMEPESGVQDATVEALPEEYLEQLEAIASDRFLVVRRSSFDAEGNLVEYVVSYLNPDHFSLHVEFGREKTQ